MKITMAAEYAVRCVLYLAKQGPGTLVSRQEIADRADVPSKFLAKIAQQLARTGIIEIRQGAKGGYRLIRPPREITLLMVVESIIGEIFLNECAVRNDVCKSSATCTVNRIWKSARAQLRETLQAVTFESLASSPDCCGSGEAPPLPVLSLHPTAMP